MPLPFSISREATELTFVTSRPSRIQTVPSPITTVQWNRDHGNRSSRAGMRVLMVPNSTSAAHRSPLLCIAVSPRYPGS